MCSIFAISDLSGLFVIDCVCVFRYLVMNISFGLLVGVAIMAWIYFIWRSYNFLQIIYLSSIIILPLFSNYMLGYSFDSPYLCCRLASQLSQVQSLELDLQCRVFTIAGMAKTRSMTRNQNHDNDASSSSRKRIASCDNGDGAPWSDLDHHLLFLVMMQLGVIDFVAFSGVCKSWRSLALDNRKIFMASRPPMLISISHRSYKKECYLQDFEGRKFKTILPRSADRICVGITCGYLILFGWKTKDFRLVNPITRHELHFPCFPYNASTNLKDVRAGTRTWNHVSSTFPFFALIAFKGKIYTLNMGCRLCEMRLNPEPKLTLLQTKILDFPKVVMLCPELISLGENLYLMNRELRDSYKVYELD
ncbi:unnamed protein product [Lactuca virosa]|uniref:F-box domain-containing protein n=1 Tax=Lactuca virosa TaxID=75947 RepID=A0AAU9M9C5_9ASTR|nr:unnamed protein product [Lactuca virosa]